MTVSSQTLIRERRRGPVAQWLLHGLRETGAGHPGPHAEPAQRERKHAWWKVMCLTGVDYFSTLGYQPGIAALAAGAISPIATLVLVSLTLLGALPVYRRVAQESPHGEGSIAILERVLSFWWSKLFVLVLLGFAATDFLITMTLSAADASAHLTQNPLLAPVTHGHNVLITLLLLAVLGAVFLKGFSEAIGIAVVLVGTYLSLNVVVIAVGMYEAFRTPVLTGDWLHTLSAQHGNPIMIVAIALLVFPKLALGLSGFETGVAVMPHIQGGPGEDDRVDDEGRTRNPAGRIRGARRLLTAAAITMSVFLVTSSVITTLLIPAAQFQPGGAANGRALAYLAHLYLGPVFGSVYDASTIAILWFAGASAMAGMLNLIPRYLPRYGMAPNWARAVRPLVLVLTGAGFLITWLFDADVDAQGGAYATGVLVLITSAAVAVTLVCRRAGQRRRMVAFGVVSLIFGYTTIDNIIERPDGVKIGAVFIATILAVSLISRLSRAFELRVTSVELDDAAERFIRECARRTIRLLANDPGRRDDAEYREKLRQAVRDNDLTDEQNIIFVEVTVRDASEFETNLKVHGEVLHGRYRVLTMEHAAVPNALAALMLLIRDHTGRRTHIYFEWTEGNPVTNLLRFLLFGAGEVAPTMREVLRRAEPDRSRRPHVHVG